MNVVPIGKGLLRITVRSQAKREKLAKLPEVTIEGTRVIFPEWLSGTIQRLLVRTPKRKRPEPPEQTTLL